MSQDWGQGAIGSDRLAECHQNLSLSLPVLGAVYGDSS